MSIGGPGPKLGIIMPVVLQSEAILAATIDAIAHLRTRHDMSVYIVCNRLRVCGPADLAQMLAPHVAGRLSVLEEAPDERSVAGAWNAGCAQANRDGANFLALVANDTRLQPACLDTLVAFGQRGTAELWSAVSMDNAPDMRETAHITDGADFNCVMFPPSTLARFGPFDESFHPAYFEDNDYYGRIVLGGGRCRAVHAARFFHHGSLTIKSDAETARHVQERFEANRAYFARKWGVTNPETSSQGVLQRYFRQPFNGAA